MENVRTENRDGVLIITVDRPKVLNALNAQTVEEIGEAFEAARNDDGVKAVIVTGGGEKAFVAGADINELAKMTPLSGKATASKGQGVFFEIERFPKPVIAAINGYALGGGCELALACHIRIASETPADRGEFRVFNQMTESKSINELAETVAGEYPKWPGSQGGVTIDHVENICTADRVNAADAEKIGLVNRVVPADQLMSVAEEMARKMASRGPVAVRCAIEAVMSGSEMPFEEGQFLEATLFGLLCATDDMKEGMKAFLEKRAAKFTGN